ncbi:MAG: ABC transporter permease [Acidobacteria bacterium]|nr:ABC transporter permease [Acidobacteriota bacterium]
MSNDLRYAIRTLRRNPGFTVIAVASLALGIGANTAIFSLVDRVLLRDLPVADPQRLVLLSNPVEGSGFSTTDNDKSVYSNPVYRELRNGTTDVFQGIAARGRWPVTLIWRGSAERAFVEIASGNYFEVLGVKTAVGRTFTDAEDQAAGSHPVAVLSWPYFQKRFGGDRAAVGSNVEMNGRSLTIIGVLGPEYSGFIAGSAPDFFIPIAMKQAATPTWEGLTQRDIRWLNLFARLAPGVSAEQAEAKVQSVWRTALELDLAKKGPPRPGPFRERYTTQQLKLTLAPQGINQTAAQWKTSLIALMAMVGLALLIACANVANLLIARAAARKREFAVRVSLGAGLWSITRQLLIESLLLSAIAGVIAMLVAAWTSDALLNALDAADNQYYAFRFDPRILLFTAATCVLTATLFGLAPAIESWRVNLVDTLKAHSANMAGGSARMRKAMVAGQLALAALLLIGSALFSRSFYRLISLDPGFRPQQVISFSVDPTLAGYDTRRSLAFLDGLSRRLSAIPGVTAVGGASPGPFTNSGRGANVSIAGYKAKEDEDMNVGQRAVTAGYFKAMGTPILAGREFTERDTANSAKVVVVNQTFVKRFLGSQNPLGVRMAWGAGDVKYELEIVGVAAPMKHSRLTEKSNPAVFYPLAQEERAGPTSYFVRSTRDAGGEIRKTVAAMDSRIPVARMRPLEDAIGDSVRTQRLIAILATAFGALATLLAGIGVYGVIAYSVLRRRNELGIRIALGAGSRHVLSCVLGEVAILAVIGLATGVALALAAGRYVRTQLYGIEPNDPATVAAAIAALAVIAFLAAYLPARRATKIDPMRALRMD